MSVYLTSVITSPIPEPDFATPVRRAAPKPGMLAIADWPNGKPGSVVIKMVLPAMFRQIVVCGPI